MLLCCDTGQREDREKTQLLGLLGTATTSLLRSPMPMQGVLDETMQEGGRQRRESFSNEFANIIIQPLPAGGAVMGRLQSSSLGSPSKKQRSLVQN